MASSREPLSVTHPELAAQADGWDTSTLSAGSSKKVGWKCEYGHIWRATVNDRSNGSGCPFCSGLRVIRGQTDLKTLNAKLAAEAFEFDPTTLAQFSSKKVGWKCERGHTWQDSVSHRSAGRGCPVCSNHQVLVGYNDLATTHSAIASQAFDWRKFNNILTDGVTTDIQSQFVSACQEFVFPNAVRYRRLLAATYHPS